jgi:hypothetical protein
MSTAQYSQMMHANPTPLLNSLTSSSYGAQALVGSLDLSGHR